MSNEAAGVLLCVLFLVAIVGALWWFNTPEQEAKRCLHEEDQERRLREEMDRIHREREKEEKSLLPPWRRGSRIGGQFTEGARGR